MNDNERKILATTQAVRIHPQMARGRDRKVPNDLVAAVAGFSMAALFAVALTILA